MRSINSVRSKDVFEFKESYCDENSIISNLLGGTLKTYLKPPILDVGAGTGDIAYRALQDQKTILIDVNAIADHDYPCRPMHTRKQVDFFDFENTSEVNTILISHTLQFIDSDIDLLNQKIRSLNPEKIVLILNSNDDFLGELVDWTLSNFKNANPEVRLEGFPEGYRMTKSQPFTATLKCPDFETLARQVAYLMLIAADDKADLLAGFLRERLATPSFIIHQTIEIYSRQ
jgi:SAM-dependent methyltransferase